MALNYFRHYLKCSYISSRCLISFMSAQKYLQFSTSETVSSKSDTPVKFTTSKGAQVSIQETIGILNPKELYTPKYERLIVTASIAAILIYFCLIREENDIDEILKGNRQNVNNRYNELMDLKIKLIYCKQNDLPTDAIKARIAEIEMSNRISSSFSK